MWMAAMSPHVPDHDAIRALHSDVIEVLGAYLDALYVGDADALAEIFHPEARYATINEGRLLHLDMESYLQLVRKRASPSSLGESRQHTIDSLQLAGGDTALATLRSRMLGKQFIDFVSLVRIEGRWRIISKVFHFDVLSNEGE